MTTGKSHAPMKEITIGFDPNRHLITKLLEVMFDPTKKATIREWKDKFVKDDNYDHIEYLKSRTPRIPEINPLYAVEENHSQPQNGSDEKRKRKKNKYLPIKRKMLMIKDSMMADSNTTIRYYAPMLRQTNRTNKVQNMAHWYTHPRPTNKPELSESDMFNLACHAKLSSSVWAIESDMIHIFPDMFYLSRLNLIIDSNSMCFQINSNGWTKVEISISSIRNVTFYPAPYYIKILFKQGCIQELVESARTLPEVSENHMRLPTKKGPRDMMMLFSKRAPTLEDVEKLKKVLGKEKVMMSNNSIEAVDQLRLLFNRAPRVVGYLRRDGKLEWPDLFKEKYVIYLEKDPNYTVAGNQTDSGNYFTGSVPLSLQQSNATQDSNNSHNNTLSLIIDKINKKNEKYIGSEHNTEAPQKPTRGAKFKSENIATMNLNPTQKNQLQTFIKNQSGGNMQNAYIVTDSNTNETYVYAVPDANKGKLDNNGLSTVNNIAASWEAANDEGAAAVASITESTPKPSSLIQNKISGMPLVDVSPIAMPGTKRPLITPKPDSNNQDEDSQKKQKIDGGKVSGTMVSSANLSNDALQNILKTVNSQGGSLKVVSGIGGQNQIVLLNNCQDQSNLLKQISKSGLKILPKGAIQQQILQQSGLKMQKSCKAKEEMLKKVQLGKQIKKIYQKKQKEAAAAAAGEIVPAPGHLEETIPDETKVLVFCPGRNLANIFHTFNYTPSPNHHVELHGTDLLCLNYGEIINDNIINFYLNYIFYELMSDTQRQRTHIFNVFFSTKLQGPFAAACTDSASVRHARVANWTKKIDIFDKDYLIIPINEGNHWFLAIVCFPWMVGMVSYDELLGSKSEEGESPTIPPNETKFATETRLLRISRLKDRHDVEALPCILLFDSLPAQPRVSNVRLIREYLKSEWDAKRASIDGPLVFDRNTIRGYNPKVPQQKNQLDCGVYLVHYVEMFFKNPLKNFTKDFFENQLIGWFDIEMIHSKREFIQNLILRKSDEQREKGDSCSSNPIEEVDVVEELDEQQKM